MSYALSATINQPFERALPLVRESLAAQGFGVLTEIDMAGTLKQKLDVDVRPQVILGACRPPLAHAALQEEATIGLLLPCNVVVRSIDEDVTAVDVVDPQVMVQLTGNEGLRAVADEATVRLSAALAAVTESSVA